MTKLIYISHPSVNIDQKIPVDQWTLSDKGLYEVQNLLEKELWKEVDVIYSSKETKASTVAKMAANKFSIVHFEEKDLGETDRSSTGFIQSEEYMNVVQEAYANIETGTRGWESHNHMMERNGKVLDKIKELHFNKTIAVVGHGGAGTTIKCYIKRIAPSFHEDPKKTGCYFIADLDNGDILQDWVKY